MFKCCNCGEIFEEPDHTTECVGEFWGMPAYETWSCCPYCGDTDIEEYIEYDEEEEDEET